jgi:hypothetical protein
MLCNFFPITISRNSTDILLDATSDSTNTELSISIEEIIIIIWVTLYLVDEIREVN